ncbi:MAG: TetR/AcrR family transcriptional regulator [Winogradskyella sp.]|nr:MAG: TetR/AcrR family transcriptional regulator [Winogradskyella sp.]
MAKKTTIAQSDLISFYMDYILIHNHRPKSVYAFAKDNNFDEAKFYEFYGSFDAIEQSIFKAFFDNTHSLLNKSEEYQSFDARNKLLSFYFTFFENLTTNRSYVVQALGKHKESMKFLKTLSLLKKNFNNYIEHLGINMLDLKQDRLEKIQNRGLKESAWLQLLITIKFWLDDTSPSFEKTDIFIEKSINTSFDIIDTMPLQSIIDLGKFMIREKVRMN